MQSQTGNPCVRCGRERVLEKRWEEYIGTSLLIRTRTICIDADCQKLVDEKTAQLKEKRLLHMNNRNRSHAKFKPAPVH